MARFLHSANAQMRRSPVAMFFIGMGLGMCSIMLMMSNADPLLQGSRLVTLQRLALDHEITDPARGTTASYPPHNGLNFASELTPETGSKVSHASRASSSRSSGDSGGGGSGGVAGDGASTSSSSSSSSSSGSGGSLKLEYPQWWKETWSNSATFGKNDVFVGDKPLIHPPCVDSKQTNDNAVQFLEPRTYLPNSKNPCWWNEPKKKDGLRCVPYFYLAGVAKSGTTDLFGRLTKHPDLLKGSQKEYHWWERLRFDDLEKWSFKDYAQQITGDSIAEVTNDLRQKGSSVKIFGDFSPSYFFHPQYWPELDGNQGCFEPRYIVTQHIRHLYPDAKVILTFRHPTARLYSRFLSRVPRTSFLKGDGPKDFHKYVVQAVKTYAKCFAKWSVRHCVYNGTLYGDVTTRLMEGMYPTFMADWLRVWPRHQMHIMRYEDYGGHEEERITELFDFLGLSRLNKTEMAKISEKSISNSGAKEYVSIGPMLPETKQILDEFYQPFINQFAEILNDKRFLWLDTKH